MVTSSNMWRLSGGDIQIDHYASSRRSILLFVIVVYSLGIIGQYFLVVTDGVENSLNQLRDKINELEIKNEHIKKRISLIKYQDASDAEKETKVLQSVFERAEFVLLDLERYKTGVGQKLSKNNIEAEVTRRLSTSLTRLSYEQEKSRRKLENLFRELWFFIKAFPFDPVKPRKENENPTPKEDANFDDSTKTENQELTVSDIFKSKVQGYKKSISRALDRLHRSDNLDDDRLAMSKELGELVQRRLGDLQNPSDCESARFLFCPSKACGFGCIIHHHVQCLIMAYATGRVLATMKVDKLAGGQDSDQMFKPLSAKCSTDNVSMPYMYGGDEPEVERELAGAGKGDEKVMRYSIVEYASEDEKKMLPLAVPADLAPKLTLFHGNPPAWWVGQIAAYVMRPTPKYQQEMNELKERLGLEGHYVGIHVRRTDKIIEAAYHELEEYMAHVDEYFEQLDEPPKTRRVFLASDEDLLSEAVRKFPRYKFIYNQNATKSRDNVEGLKGVVTDINFLSDARYLVCTFSSQVCRLAYELMQTKHGDASSWFRSLDDIYYFGGQFQHLVRAVEPSEEGVDPDGVKIMGLEKGDLIHTAGNHWNGYSKGTHYETGDTALYPTYKTEEVQEYACLPEYPHITTGSKIPYI